MKLNADSNPDASVRAATRRFLSVIVFCILLDLALSLAGCTVVTRRSISLHGSDKSVGMFGRYRLTVEGVCQDTFNQVYFTLAFGTPISDTGVVDTIPILVMDSVCLSGECLGADVCRRPESWLERAKRYPGLSSEPYHPPDLWHAWGKLEPGGFDIEWRPAVPLPCYGSTLTCQVFARLVDRVSGDTIAEEVTKFLVKVRKWSRWEPMS
jgi:hypothetical protein